MATDIDRKKLWGRSGSRCAICNCPLTEANGVDSIVGDEAHVRSPKLGGPRHDASYPSERLNTYSNLILLCKNHHKLVDDNVEVFPIELLEAIKKRHETRVARALTAGEAGWVVNPEISRIDNGTTLMTILDGVYAYLFYHDHPESVPEADAIGNLLEDAKDWADLAGDIGPKGKVEASMTLHEQLTELDELGFSVYGGRGTYRVLPDLVVPALALQVVRITVPDTGKTSWTQVSADERP